MINRNKKFVFIFMSLILMTLTLAACGGNKTNDPAAKDEATNAPKATEAPTERKLTDALGHEVTIPANPQRIIASYLEDHLVTLGIKPVAQWSVPNGTQEYLKDSIADVPTIAFDLPFEAVTSFSPDLILMAYDANVEGEKFAQYTKIAPTFTIGDKLIADWRATLLKVGEVVGKSEEAQKALDTYDAKAKDAKEKLQTAVAGKSAAAVWYVAGNFYVVSDKLSSGDLLYNQLGLTVPAVVKEISAAGTGNWNAIPLEKLAELDADHLFLVNSGTEADSKAFEDPIWKNIPAVKNGQVYEYPASSSWLYAGTIAYSQVIDDVLESLVK